jgi:site-specific recombinase XerD
MKTRQQLKAEALKKATDMLRLQRKALTTEQCYLHWIGSFIDGGAAIRDVQELMGHSSLETTMGYVRPHPGRVPSLL